MRDTPPMRNIHDRLRLGLRVPERITMVLTGRIRFRMGWFGRPIAMVEEAREVRRGNQPPDSPPIGVTLHWRDADRADLFVRESRLFKMEKAK